ncbi:MAG: tRNA (guanosine(18)-2'-O)-methyltransferase [Chlamydiae bacterium]|nr:tRNA (guanosine(18)-2'-O)-methyltransferase [Chlamydiota bacterium]
MFTQKKFNSLSIEAQHKKVAELLKKIYFQFDQETFFYIQKLETYMGLKWTIHDDLESLSNSFHKHMGQTGNGISEHSLLIKNRDLDKASKDWLNAVIYLDHLRSAHNVGNIVRTTEAFRLGKLCFSDNMPDISHPSVCKTSMGTHHWVETVDKPIAELPAPLIVIETHQKSIKLQDFKFPKTFTLVLGNEEYGVSEKLLEKADQIVEVPLCGQKNSLNVAACFSILAWKIDQDLRKTVSSP